MAWVECERRENPGALPPFPAWEEVLATETGDFVMMAGSEITGNVVENVTRFITEWDGVALSDSALGIGVPKCSLCKSELIPDFLDP